MIEPARQHGSRRSLVLACVMVGTFMAAVEATIVATAMPRIVADVGGFSLYAWVFSVFLMAQAATAVIYGKLSDLLGRRPTLIAGILIFLGGSLLCGLAWSMASLILFRAIQGIGAGAIQPLANTIVGDHYGPEERAHIQGYIGAVWGVSSIIGPVIGGSIVEHVSWSWIFWLNLPIGLLTIVGLLAFLHEEITPKRHQIDYLGALLFTVTIIALLLLLTSRDGAFGSTAASVSLALVAAIGLALFVAQERRAAEPMISFALWSDRLIATVNSATVLIGVLLIGLTSILPVFIQAVLARSPIVAGLTVATLSVGWPVASMNAPRFYRHFDPRGTMRLGGVLISCGAAVFLFLDERSSIVLVGSGGFVMGFGIGLLATTALILVQSSVDWTQRGSATASNVFARSLGSTIGAAVFGAVLHFGLYRAAPELGPSVDPVRSLIEHAPDAGGATQQMMQHALAYGVHLTFFAMMAFAVMTSLLAFVVPARDLHGGPVAR